MTENIEWNRVKGFYFHGHKSEILFALSSLGGNTFSWIKFYEDWFVSFVILVHLGKIK